MRKLLKQTLTIVINYSRILHLRAFIGVETAALTFRTEQYSTSYNSHICYGKRFYNDFFLNHNTIALVHNCLKLLSCVVIETALDGMKKNQSIILTVSFQLENVPFNVKSYRFECNDCSACSQTIMTHHFAFGYSRKGQHRRIVFSFVKSMVCLTVLFF